MSKDEALKLALEALEGWGKGFPDNWGDLDTEAVTAIKKALAQQCVCGEPNSAGTHRIDGPCLAPQPEQEPVAWITEKISGPTKGYMTVTFNKDTGWKDARSIPLYEHPPQRTWVGLTDDEIDQGLLRSDYAFKTAEAWRAGVVFAMTKLKEKNT